VQPRFLHVGSGVNVHYAGADTRLSDHYAGKGFEWYATEHIPATHHLSCARGRCSIESVPRSGGTSSPIPEAPVIGAGCGSGRRWVFLFNQAPLWDRPLTHGLLPSSRLYALVVPSALSLGFDDEERNRLLGLRPETSCSLRLFSPRSPPRSPCLSFTCSTLKKLDLDNTHIMFEPDPIA